MSLFVCVCEDAEDGGTLTLTGVDNDVDNADDEDNTDRQDKDDYTAVYGVIL